MTARRWAREAEVLRQERDANNDALQDTLRLLVAAEQQVAELRADVRVMVRVAKEAEAARDAAREETARVREALVKVHAHTGWRVPTDGSTLESLLKGLLATIERITDAALTHTPPQPAARTEEG